MIIERVLHTHFSRSLQILIGVEVFPLASLAGGDVELAVRESVGLVRRHSNTFANRVAHTRHPASPVHRRHRRAAI